MKTFEIAVKGRAIHANSADTRVVRTSVGIDQIHVLFDNAEWTDFPVKVTFANGNVQPVTTSLVLVQLDSTEWAAEATCTIPWEVIQVLGGIRITFQGTDSSGKHIITEASGTPLTVVEEGDVVEGSAPQPDPTVDEWHQAYADAMAAASDAASAAEQVAEILHSTDAQTLEELIAALGSAIRYKGSVATYADLPDDAEPGDMYNVAAAYGDYPAGTNWAWTVGETWDALGGEIDLSVFATKDSPALTGTPTAPTAATGTDTTQVATTAFVQQEIEAQPAATTTDDGLMSSADKAKLDGIEAQANRVTAGDGLTLESGEMALGPLVQSGNPTHGCALYGVDAQGWAEQDGTPTPESPVPIEVCRGRNLLQVENGTYNTDYVTKLDNSARVRCMNPIPVKADETYALTLASDTGKTVQCVKAWLDASMSVIETSGWNTTTSVTPPANAAYVVAIFRYSDQSAINASDVKLQLELGSTPTPYVPYGHVGLEVTPKNLAPFFSARNDDANVWNPTLGAAFTQLEDGWTRCSYDNSSGESSMYIYFMLNALPYIKPSETYTVMVEVRNAESVPDFINFGAATAYQISGNNLNNLADGVFHHQLSSRADLSTCTTLMRSRAQIAAGASVDFEMRVSLYEGEYDGPYLEYGERTVTPIPLPSKGWAGGLPDGAADALFIDSAGGYRWTNTTWMADTDAIAQNAGNGVALTDYVRISCASALSPASIASNTTNGYCNALPFTGDGYSANTLHAYTHNAYAYIFAPIGDKEAWDSSTAAEWIIEHGVTILYPLATPTVESGYIDLPALPDGATVSCPELDALGVQWWVKGADAVLAHATNERRRIEVELDDIREAIADL